VTVLLLPAFFAFTGMRTQIGLVSGAEQWLLCGAIIVVATAGKFGGTLVAARLTGLGWRTSASLGVLMNTRGLMELIALNIGRVHRLRLDSPRGPLRPITAPRLLTVPGPPRRKPPPQPWLPLPPEGHRRSASQSRPHRSLRQPAQPCSSGLRRPHLLHAGYSG